MRIIIPGGTGQIGRPLSAMLVSAGHEVIVLSRNPQNYSLPAGVQSAQWDTQTTAGWGELLDGADAVINLAGENISGTGMIPSRWTADRKRRIGDSRAAAGAVLVQAIDEAAEKPQVFFQISGVDYYAPGDQLVDETWPPGTGFLSRVASEIWEPSTEGVEALGVRRIVGRMGVILSMAGGPLPFSVLQFRLFAGGKLGNGEQWLPWVHEEDALRAIQFLVEHESAAGVYNIASPEPVTNAQFTEALGRVMGRPTLIPVPGFALKLSLGEISALVLEGRPVSSQKLQDLGFKFYFADIEPALEDLIKG